MGKRSERTHVLTLRLRNIIGGIQLLNAVGSLPERTLLFAYFLGCGIRTYERWITPVSVHLTGNLLHSVDIVVSVELSTARAQYYQERKRNQGSNTYVNSGANHHGVIRQMIRAILRRRDFTPR